MNSQQDIDLVRRFWNKNPLFVGESRSVPGEKSFFEEHKNTLIYEFSGLLDPIFTRDIKPGKAVIDIGCGIGFWVHQFCDLDANVYAIDLSEISVSLTQTRKHLYGLSACACVGNAECLPYPTSTFDHVNCYGVIHHTPNTHQCIREFHRVLKPGGTFCFGVYYKNWILRQRGLFRAITRIIKPLIDIHGRGRERMLLTSSPEELVRLYDGADNPIGKAFTRSEIQAMLDSDIEILEVKRFGFPRRMLPIKINDSIHRFLSKYFGLMIVYRCKKK